VEWWSGALEDLYGFQVDSRTTYQWNIEEVDGVVTKRYPSLRTVPGNQFAAMIIKRVDQGMDEDTQPLTPREQTIE
jgi:hypothetical protein